MVLVVADRVQETTSTTGTSDYTLLGAEPGFQSFGDVMSNADTTYYAITDDTDWEVGIGTYSTTGPTMARTTILSSSNGNAAVSWSAGTKKIFLSYAAERAVYLDESGDLSVDGTTLFVDAANDRVGIGTATPAVKTEISGNTALACLFSGTVTGTTLDVTSVSSGALAVGQYLATSNGRIRITALGTGTGGVGTYTIDTDQTGQTFFRSYTSDTTTTRLSNSQTTYFNAMPYGTIEFGGSTTNTGPRGYVQVQAQNSGSQSLVADMLFGVGAANGSSPPRTVMRLNSVNAIFPNSLTLGASQLSPRNGTISPAAISLQGRSQTIYSSGAALSSLSFITSYIDASVETTATYGQLGYLVDSSITSGQLPSNFYIQTRNASGTTAERLRINKDGNVGVGTTVLDWSTSRRAISLAGGPTVSVFNHASFTGETLYNAYLGPTGFYTYQVDGPAARVDFNGISSGVAWSVAPSGTTGNNITFSQEMTLLLNGNLGLGTNSPAYRLDVNGTANATTLSIGGTAITATAAELNFVDGVTSNIQTQLDSKGPKGGGSNAVFYENDQTVTDNYTIPAGKNAMSTGPVTVNAGVTVTVSAGARYVVI